METPERWADACTRNCVWLFQRRLHYRTDGEDSYSTWHTEGVFLTRVEGIDFGFSRHYDHGTYGEDWRLYGVPAHGDMVSLLAKAGVNHAFIKDLGPEADRLTQEWQQKLAKKQ